MDWSSVATWLNVRTLVAVYLVIVIVGAAGVLPWFLLRHLRREIGLVSGAIIYSSILLLGSLGLAGDLRSGVRAPNDDVWKEDPAFIPPAVDPNTPLRFEATKVGVKSFLEPRSTYELSLSPGLTSIMVLNGTVEIYKDISPTTVRCNGGMYKFRRTEVAPTQKTFVRACGGYPVELNVTAIE